jgi:hypothetical protein
MPSNFLLRYSSRAHNPALNIFNRSNEISYGISANQVTFFHFFSKSTVNVSKIHTYSILLSTKTTELASAVCTSQSYLSKTAFQGYNSFTPVCKNLNPNSTARQHIAKLPWVLAIS